MVLHTRGVGPVDRLVEQARASVASLDADLPILFARPLAEATRGAFIFLDLTAVMLFVFGVAGMALAAMGTYGLVSYVVEQSTREIGIRMALGATRVSVVRGFLGRGLRLGAVGAALGIVAALGLTRLLGGVLFGVSTTDAISFARALAVVLGGVVVATVVPAWRAARTNPLTALRHQ
jgi:putative ABC transport system permease protein